MNPECPNCDATSTRRLSRGKSLRNRFRYFFGFFPWECLNCQEQFFSSTRNSRSGRHPLGEVYTDAAPRPVAGKGSKESPSE
jgi:hypothetical protein